LHKRKLEEEYRIQETGVRMKKGLEEDEEKEVRF